MRRVTVPDCEALAKAVLAAKDANETGALIEAFEAGSGDRVRRRG